MTDNEQSTTDLIFEEPPETRGRRAGDTPLGLWLASLREHPGKWAKFPEPQMTAGSVSAIKAGRAYGTKPGEFEATSRAATNKRFWIYARYIGGES